MKKHLSMLLAVLMLFAFAASAFAATTASADFEVSNDRSNITCSTDIVVTEDGKFGAYIYEKASATLNCNITTEGDGSHAVFLSENSYVAVNGNLDAADTTGAASTCGIYIKNNCSVDMTGNIRNQSLAGRGFWISQRSTGTLLGDVAVSGDRAVAVYTWTDSGVTMTGNVTLYVPGIERESYPNRKQYGAGVGARIRSSVALTGNVVVNGEYGLGLWADNNSVIQMRDGNIRVSLNDTSWAMSMSNNSTIDLTNVTTDSDNKNLLTNDRIITNVRDDPDYSGTLNVSGNSDLTGDILYYVVFPDNTLTLNLSDSVWTGSAEASGDIGGIDINLAASDWNITGDSDTNGIITGDAASNMNFHGTTDVITVEVYSLGGNPSIEMKPGDRLIIKNSDGTNDGIESSDPDVIEVVENADGSIEIISKGEGEAELSYTYIDEDGSRQTGTISVTSKTPSSTPTASSRGGSSSNCNSGVGAAFFALAGLFLVGKRKR